jgi:predicted nuclease with RNAse H fold
MRLIGIDYGSKMAGTTVLAMWDGESLLLKSSEKKKDADAFLLKEISALRPQQLYLDAPTSLPGRYRELAGYQDYFYRQCDKAMGAMSPMFLGGLTARAMKLKDQLQAQGFPVWETYPAWQARRLELKAIGYKGKLGQVPDVLSRLKEEFPFPLPSMLPNWHQVDALLALLGGLRHQQGQAEVIGQAEEGVIVV